jgi:hypothetical protein
LSDAALVKEVEEGFKEVKRRGLEPQLGLFFYATSPPPLPQHHQQVNAYMA